jgi:hypothetical protein
MIFLHIDDKMLAACLKAWHGNGQLKLCANEGQGTGQMCGPDKWGPWVKGNGRHHQGQKLVKLSLSFTRGNA